jgi:hypothetical protein
MKIERINIILVITLFCILFMVYFIIRSKDKIDSKVKCENSHTTCLYSEEVKHLSLKLNEAQREIGRLSCQIQEKDGVSLHGGWCKDISGKESKLHMTDNNLAKELSNLLQNKKVASFGDGPGEYKRIITGLNKVKSYDAFDGAPYAEETTNNLVQHLDLSVPVYHLPLYDWVVSMEVAEHIPKQYEQIFIDNLTRHAKEGIILSWSVVGQEGHSHVNNQDLPYVEEQLRKRGFKIDKALTNRVKGASSFHWLKRNLYVYLRKNI